MTRGKFITLEGGEGVGKSSCLKVIVTTLRARGITSVATREPGGTGLGEQLRSVLLDKNNTDITPDAELLLMFAARAQHIDEIIRPTLQCGDWVISDRFTDASFAYQGGGREIPPQRIERLERWLHADLNPDLTILLDAPVGLGLQRVDQRGEKDRFERERIEFFGRVRSHYLQRARQYPERFRVVSSEQPLDEMKAAVRDHITELIESSGVND